MIDEGEYALFGMFKKKPEIVEPPLRFGTSHQIPPIDPVVLAQAKWVVYNAVIAHASTMIIQVTQQGVAVQYIVDTISHEGPGSDPASAANVNMVLKAMAGIDLAQPKPLAEGKFSISVPGKKYPCTLTCQLGRGSERVTLAFDDGSKPPEKFEDAGMRPKMIEQLKEAMKEPGIVVISSPPKQGFTTSFNNTIRLVDRYLRNVVAVEDEQGKEKQVENAPITTYNSQAGETPFTVLPKLLRTYPDVVCVRQPTDGETLDLLCEQPDRERLVLMGVGALDAVEALPRLLAMKAPRDKLAKHVKAVLNMRLLRKLCEACKEAYPPPPQLLKQLGVPAGRIKAFYRQGPPPQPPVPPNAKEPPPPVTICPGCNGLGYRTRTAIFELLVVNDQLREALQGPARLDDLRKIAKQSGHATLLDEGILACAQGVTSVQEVLRVLKG